MTANQINYYKARQEAKHWKRSDKENARHNKADEGIRSESNAITEWFNQQTAQHYIRQDAINDSHYQRMDAETQRHNRMNEQYNLLNLNLGYDELKVKKQQADTAERNAAINAFLALDPFGVSSSTAKKNTAQTEGQEIENEYAPTVTESEIDVNKSQVWKNTIGGGTDILKGILSIGKFVLPFLIP